jgi:putative ABC transport system substrate-binding protein
MTHLIEPPSSVDAASSRIPSGKMPLPLLVFALLALLAALSARAEKVVMVMTSRGCEDVCKSFKRNLEIQGDVSFIMRDADGDMGRVAGFVAEARKLRPDLVATWGTGVTQAVVGKHDAVDPARHLTDIPVVYMYVGNPVDSKIAVSAEKSGRPNVAGANTSVPIDAQVKLLMSFKKNIRRIAMLYNIDEPAPVDQAAIARKVFETNGIQVSQIALGKDRDGKPDAADIAPAIAQLALDRPDFIYHIGSSFIISQMGAISQAASAQGIPIFTAFENAYRAGDVLLGLISPLTGVGQIAAYQAGQILFRGKKPDSLPSPTLSRFSVLINMRPAHALKIYPPIKLLQFAEVTR